jgi:hypothetical protein
MVRISVPLASERLKRLDESWKLRGKRGEVVRGHEEVPVGELMRDPGRPGAREPDTVDEGMAAHERRHDFADVHVNPTRARSA